MANEVTPEASTQVTPPSIFGDKEQTPKVEEKPPEVKVEEPKAPEEKPEEKTETPAPEKSVAPEKYELKLSDNSLLEKTALDRIEAYARSQGLSQEAAQSAVEAEENHVSSFIETRKEQWKQQSLKDPEIGGQMIKENIAIAHRAMEQYATPALKAELEKTGYGNHPEIIRMFVRVGKASQEDKAIIPRSHDSSDDRPLHEKFYGKSNN